MVEPFAKEEIKVPYSEVIRLFVGSRPEGSEEILMQRAFFFQVPKLILIFPNEIDRPLYNRFILRAWGLSHSIRSSQTIIIVGFFMSLLKPL